MRIHLVTYATNIFLLRQRFLELSALANNVVDTVTAWTPKILNDAGFKKRAPQIDLDSRGSGFWAWKPFIIENKLSQVPDGDIILYCDVGRRNNFKLLNRSLNPLLAWMSQQKQDVMPGLLIPWKGPMSMWTKRDAFFLLGMDTPEAHMTAPIQASFSVWRASPASRGLASRWMDLCAQPHLINDERGLSGLPDLPDFVDHRHDQSLLTLCCLENHITGLDLGIAMPPIDTQHPSQVIEWHFESSSSKTTLAGTMLRTAAWPCEVIEKAVRRIAKIR